MPAQRLLVELIVVLAVECLMGKSGLFFGPASTIRVTKAGTLVNPESVRLGGLEPLIRSALSHHEGAPHRAGGPLHFDQADQDVQED